MDEIRSFTLRRKDKAMIKEAIYYEMYCDRCGKQLDDGDIVAYKEKEGLEFVASESEWQTINGKHYCPDCYELDEETDEYVPKKGGINGINDI